MCFPFFKLSFVLLKMLIMSYCVFKSKIHIFIYIQFTNNPQSTINYTCITRYR